MNVGTASSESNPNHSYFNSKGMWVTYLLMAGIVHFIFMSIPVLSVSVAWTLTNLTHNMVMYVVLHVFKGTPWESADQGADRLLTQWEQMDCGRQFTPTKKFLTIVPVVLFFLVSFYTKYSLTHCLINGISLALVLIPKLPQLHGVRIFNINKY